MTNIEKWREDFRNEFDAHLVGTNIPWEIRQRLENWVASKASTLLQTEQTRIAEEVVEEAIAVVVNNSTPSNDQMNVVRALRKLSIIKQGNE